MSDLELLKHINLLLQYFNMSFTASYSCMTLSSIEHLSSIKLHTRSEQNKKQSDIYILSVINSSGSSEMINNPILLLYIVHWCLVNTFSVFIFVV